MPLTVLGNAAAFTPSDFVRLFHQSQLEWSRHVGEETELDFGRWIFSKTLLDCDDANCLHDAFLVPGLAGKDLLLDMQHRCENTGVPWRRCSLNPSAAVDQSQQLTASLEAAGWTADPLQIFYHVKKPVGAVQQYSSPPLTIIPSRAGYQQYRKIIEQRKAGSADIALLHLDDSHVDSLLALADGEPVGCVSLLAGGEVGTIRDWFVSPAHRRKGIGRLLLNRALEIAARGLLRHVMIGLPTANEPAIRLCNARGFASIGQWKAYRKAE